MLSLSSDYDNVCPKCLFPCKYKKTLNHHVRFPLRVPSMRPELQTQFHSEPPHPLRVREEARVPVPPLPAELQEPGRSPEPHELRPSLPLRPGHLTEFVDGGFVAKGGLS